MPRNVRLDHHADSGSNAPGCGGGVGAHRTPDAQMRYDRPLLHVAPCDNMAQRRVTHRARSALERSKGRLSFQESKVWFSPCKCGFFTPPCWPRPYERGTTDRSGRTAPKRTPACTKDACHRRADCTAAQACEACVARVQTDRQFCMHARRSPAGPTGSRRVRGARSTQARSERASPL